MIPANGTGRQCLDGMFLTDRNGLAGSGDRGRRVAAALPLPEMPHESEPSGLAASGTAAMAMVGIALFGEPVDTIKAPVGRVGVVGGVAMLHLGRPWSGPQSSPLASLSRRVVRLVLPVAERLGRAASLSFASRP